MEEIRGLIRGWVLLVVGVVGLASMPIAYHVTYEQAPSVRVRWRDGTSDWRRTVLEMKYHLVQPTGREGLSFSYILMDTRRSNIEHLVKDPEAADTHDIDRRQFEVPYWTASYSQQLMWIADRIPGLRWPVVRWTVVAMLAAMTLAGAGLVIRGVSARVFRDA